MFELKRFWKMKVTDIGVVFGALETATDRIVTWINGIGCHCTVELLEKFSLKERPRIKLKVMNTKANEHCTTPKAFFPAIPALIDKYIRSYSLKFQKKILILIIGKYKEAMIEISRVWHLKTRKLLVIGK